MLPQHVGGAFDQAGALGDDRDRPAVAHESDDVIDRPVRLASETGDGLGLEANVLVGVAVVGVAFGPTIVEPAHRPPRSSAGRLAQRVQGDEIAGIQINRRLGPGRRGVPRCAEELAVGFGERDGASCDLLGCEHRDRGIRWKVVREGHQTIDERGGERLHAIDGDAFTNLGQHARQARELVLHLAGPLAHALTQK